MKDEKLEQKDKLKHVNHNKSHGFQWFQLHMNCNICLFEL